MTSRQPGSPAARRLGLLAAVFYIAHHIVVKTNLYLIGGVVRRLGGGEELKVHHIYQCGVSDEGGYSGEDVSICNVLRTMGYRVWAFPDMTLTHTGTYTWTGNMAKHMEAKDA